MVVRFRTGIGPKDSGSNLSGTAEDFDAKANTSTAAELRKTYLELKRSLGETGQHDPLEALLKR